jgi:Rne/Rng family ribonuclease
VGKSNRLEDTIVKTNTDATKEIVRQIRLRDLGGIIVMDFIDGDERKNRQKVMQALERFFGFTGRAFQGVLRRLGLCGPMGRRQALSRSPQRTPCKPPGDDPGHGLPETP